MAQDEALWLTPKVNVELERLTAEHGVRKEGLGNVLLLLAMCDEIMVKQAVNIIRTLQLGGTTDLTNKGW